MRRFGGPAALAAARAALAARGVRLLLDYVPNHVAPDHPWVTSHPELFVHGDAARHQGRAGRPGWPRPGSVLAHGRDPYFPPWPDVVQLNAFSPALRAATADDPGRYRRPVRRDPLRHGHADDNEVFARTWGGRTGPAPEPSSGRPSSARCAPGTRRPC